MYWLLDTTVYASVSNHVSECGASHAYCGCCWVKTCSNVSLQGAPLGTLSHCQCLSWQLWQMPLPFPFNLLTVAPPPLTTDWLTNHRGNELLVAAAVARTAAEECGSSKTSSSNREWRFLSTLKSGKHPRRTHCTTRHNGSFFLGPVGRGQDQQHQR